MESTIMISLYHSSNVLLFFQFLLWEASHIDLGGWMILEISSPMLNSPISHYSTSILILHNLHRISNSHLILDMLNYPQNFCIDRLLVKQYMSNNLLTQCIDDLSSFIDLNRINTKYIPNFAIIKAMICFSEEVSIIKVHDYIDVIAVLISITTANVMIWAIVNCSLLIVLLARCCQDKN